MLNSTKTLSFLMCWWMLFPYSLLAEISYFEIVPDKGEGIYQLLRRKGLPANHIGLQVFRNLNINKLEKGTEIHPDVRYRLPIIQTSVDTSFENVLQKLGVYAHREAVLQYNLEYNDRFAWGRIADVPPHQILLVPEVQSGFYEPAFLEKYMNALIYTGVDIQGLTLPYPKIKNAITPGAVGKQLSGYYFVLDPGHGGNDPGTMPIVKRGDGKETQVYEAPLVYDTCLRLLKHLILNGGTVFFTHYSPDHGIRDINNP